MKDTIVPHNQHKIHSLYNKSTPNNAKYTITNIYQTSHKKFEK